MLSNGQEDNNPPKSVLRELVGEFGYNNSHVTIARCNVAENDVPVRIYDIPTVELYPAGQKRRPVHYFGNTDNIEEYIEFIESEGPQDTRFKPLSRRNTPETMKPGQTNMRQEEKPEQ